MQNTIRNLIFDVGDVLVEYRWKDMLMEHGLSEEEAIQVADAMFGCYLWEESFDKGLLSEEEIIEAYHREVPEYGDVIEWFIRNGEQMHVPRPEIGEKIGVLKRMGYKIYILSNYSETLFRKHTKDAVFLPYVDGGIVSYQLHLAKPDPAIYLALLERYQLTPSDCMFFDDRIKNVEAANELGIRAIQVTSREFLNNCLDRLISEKQQKMNVRNS